MTLESERPGSIRTIGMVIMVLSSVIIFGNAMGALMWALIGSGDAARPGQAFLSPGEFVFAYYLEMCLFMISIGILFVLGGLFLRKRKLWANRFVTIISGVELTPEHVHTWTPKHVNM